MKLVFCKNCSSVFSLNKDKHWCHCEKSWGYYKPDGLCAVVGGAGIPIGFDNSSFTKALINRPAYGYGATFEAFVIPEVCPTVEYEEG